MTIYNYSGSATTYTLFQVNSSLAVTSTVILQVVFSSSAAGASLSATASANVSAGTLMTLTSGSSNAGTVPGGNGFFDAFSCD
jgi:hypothetical protein